MFALFPLGALLIGAVVVALTKHYKAERGHGRPLGLGVTEPSDSPRGSL